jgi:hypothetical protein
MTTRIYLCINIFNLTIPQCKVTENIEVIKITKNNTQYTLDKEDPFHISVFSSLHSIFIHLLRCSAWVDTIPVKQCF